MMRMSEQMNTFEIKNRKLYINNIELKNVTP